MNWEQLRSYVNEEGRTRAQLQRVARTLGINPDVTGGLLLHNINRNIAARIRSEGPEAMSGFTLPNSNRNRNNGGSRRQTNTPRRRPNLGRSTGSGQTSNTMLNQYVVAKVETFHPNEDEDLLRQIAPHYGIDNTQNFFSMRNDMKKMSQADRSAHAPQEVHDIITEWEANRRQSPGSPPDGSPSNGGNMNWLLRLAAVTAAAILILVVGLVLYNAFDDDNGSTPAGTDPTPTATATSPAGGNVDLNDPRIAQIIVQVNNGTIEDEGELRSALQSAGLNSSQINDIVKNPIVVAALANDGGDDSASGSGSTSSGSNSTTAVQAAGTYSFPAPSSNLDSMPKRKIDGAPLDTWFHRVFNEALFKAPNWDGADSWFVTLALGRNSGGNWTSHGNPGQIVYRGTSTNINWCVGLLTTAQYKEQFLAGAGNYDVAVNVRIAPNSPVNVITSDGQTQSGTTSDAGDITIILPDSGVTTVCVAYQTAAPTHESLVWWGPYDRSENINTIDAR